MDRSSSGTARIIIAASGSGGHLFPALEIARALQERAPGAEVLFVGSGRPLEAELIDGAGYCRKVLRTVGVQNRGLKGFGEFLLTLPRAFWECWRLFGSFSPQAVVGVGGYVSFIPVVVAVLRGIPTWIHEAEESLGLANRVLARYATCMSVAVPGLKVPAAKKVIYTGQPVRRVLHDLRRLSRSAGGPAKLLILGGSQGALSLDQALPKLGSLLLEFGLQVWHQARPEDCAEVLKAYNSAGIEAKVEPFIRDMHAAYRWADLIVSRSGAGTVREIGIVNIPAVFVPFPFSQGGHQVRNAQQLVEQGKAILVEEGSSFLERLERALRDLLDAARYQRMRSQAYESADLQAAERIAVGILDLIR